MVTRKTVESEQTVPWRRIVYKLDLNSIYPEKSRDVQFNATMVKISQSKNFNQNASILLDHEKLYFTTSVDRPAVLKVNVYLNSTLNSTQEPTEDLRKFTKVFTVKAGKAPKKHVFELKAAGSLDDVLKSEKEILSEFETKIWKSAKPCKDCLSIAYIRRDGDQYRIGVASTQGPSYLLDEFCFLGNIPGEYLKITNLDVNRKVASCKPIKTVNQAQSEQYVVNVFVNVTTKPLEMVRGFWENVKYLGGIMLP